MNGEDVRWESAKRKDWNDWQAVRLARAPQVRWQESREDQDASQQQDFKGSKLNRKIKISQVTCSQDFEPKQKLASIHWYAQPSNRNLLCYLFVADWFTLQSIALSETFLRGKDSISP